MSKQVVLAAALAAALTSAVVAATAEARSASTATAASKTYVLKATLNAKHAVPAPRGARAAKGVFTAKLTVAGKKSSLVWQLRFSHLTGTAVSAHVHYGAAGEVGPIALPLCRRCKASAHGAYTGPYVATSGFLKAFLHGKTYADIHTKKNPKGEIRGQVKVTSA
jgi:hypothetical protein